MEADPSTLSSSNRLGDLLRKPGKLSEAEPFAREALETSRRALGDGHPPTADSLRRYVKLLEQARPGEPGSLLTDSLATIDLQEHHAVGVEVQNVFEGLGSASSDEGDQGGLPRIALRWDLSRRDRGFETLVRPVGWVGPRVGPVRHRWGAPVPLMRRVLH